MNREVHYGRTLEWAVDEGFSHDEAKIIAHADNDVDRKYHVRHWRNKGYHFAWLGARLRARRLFSKAVTDSDLVALGEALHCVQDAIGHGARGHFDHWDGIDRWEMRSEAIRQRLERESRTMLAEYLRRSRD